MNTELGFPRQHRRDYAHFAAQEHDVVGQIRGWLRWFAKLNIKPKTITIAPEVELDLMRELDALQLLATQHVGCKLKTLYGLAITVDDERSPRGVVIE